MAIDVPSFLSAYPEFGDAPVPLVSAKLVEAQQLVPDTIWGNGSVSGGLGGGGSLTQQATFLHCAHFLALSPYGRKMALVDKDGHSLYSDRINLLKRIVTSGFRVL